jgi:short-subunit dehydrogenase
MTTTGTRPLAVVTGASTGIGRELAHVLAGHGYDLLITAEGPALEESADELRNFGADVQSVRVDLATHDGTEQLYAAVRATGRPVDVLALNAGVGQGGRFLDTDLADEARIIDLNVTSTVHLAKRMLPDMVARDEGRVLVTSSIAATMPGSYQAVYNASKSFLQSFAQALSDELKDSRVTVTSLMPGPTETHFFRRARMEHTPIGRQQKDDPRQVAEQGYEAMLAGRRKVVAGSAMTRAQGMANKVLPDALKAATHRKMAQPNR